MDNDDQILQEQDRDYKRAVAELIVLLEEIEANATILRTDMAKLRELIKILGVNI